MNFLGLGKKKLNIRSNSVLALTEEGKKVAEGQVASGRSYAILSQLQERNFREAGVIAEELDLSFGETKEAIRGLAAKGYLKVLEEKGL